VNDRADKAQCNTSERDRHAGLELPSRNEETQHTHGEAEKRKLYPKPLSSFRHKHQQLRRAGSGENYGGSRVSSATGRDVRSWPHAA